MLSLNLTNVVCSAYFLKMVFLTTLTACFTVCWAISLLMFASTVFTLSFNSITTTSSIRISVLLVIFESLFPICLRSLSVLLHSVHTLVSSSLLQLFLSCLRCSCDFCCCLQSYILLSHESCSGAFVSESYHEPITYKLISQIMIHR